MGDTKSVSHNAEGLTRLFVAADLAAGVALVLPDAASHYLTHVLRAASGDGVRIFNGRDGEWDARIEKLAKFGVHLTVGERLRAQAAEPDLWLVFAPIKRAPIDYLAQKATELGVSRLQPVFTRYTAVSRVNVDRLRANAIEAAEQTGRLTVPEVAEPVTLDAMMAAWPRTRPLVVLDETGQGAPLAEALAGSTLRAASAVAILVGPEGGFAPAELDALRVLPFVTPVRLGPRILRADTAALSALACWQAWVGDWRDPPHGACR